MQASLRPGRSFAALNSGEGRGVPQDYVQAHMWVNLAAARTNGDDQTKYSRERDSIAKKMSPQQIWCERCARRTVSASGGPAEPRRHNPIRDADQSPHPSFSP